MTFVRFLEWRPSTFTTVILGLAGILGIGVLDFVTGYEVSMFIFYGLPIIAVAWFGDKKLAILVALIAGLIWWWADHIALHPYRWGWLQGWEASVRFTFFLFTAFSGSLLKAHYDAAKHRIALLEHSHQQEQEIVAISEQEQRRLGQDLHDGICQSLTALRYSASSLHADLRKAGRAEWACIAQDLADHLKETVGQTRDLARGLVPMQMHEIGLIAALEELTRSSSRLLDIECAFSSRGEMPALADNAAVNLYRIVQEAMNNAVKHSGARKIEVSLETSATGTELRIEDDGTGFDPNALSTGGLGLKIMDYRSRALGGELHIDPNPLGGTIVRCLIGEGTSHASSHELFESVA